MLRWDRFIFIKINLKIKKLIIEKNIIFIFFFYIGGNDYSLYI